MQDKSINGIIYVATNLVNGKQYVGQTIQKLSTRIIEHSSKSRKGKSIISDAIEKYGRIWFNWKIIDNANSIEDLNNKEVYWIKKLNTLVPIGYNLTPGGKNHMFLESTKLKISQANTKNYLTYNGTTKSIPDWAKELNITTEAIYNRIKWEWNIEEILSKNKKEKYKIIYNNDLISLSELSKNINISCGTLQSRINNNWNIKDISKPVKQIRKINFNSRELTVKEWSKELNISVNFINRKLKEGWSIEKTLSSKPLKFKEMNKKLITYNNKTQSMSDWANEYNITLSTLSLRLKKGLSFEEAITMKVKKYRY